MLDPYATLSTSSEDARLTSPPPPFPSAVRRPRPQADRHSRGLMLMSEEGNADEGGGVGRRCWKGKEMSSLYTEARP